MDIGPIDVQNATMHSALTGERVRYDVKVPQHIAWNTRSSGPDFPTPGTCETSTFRASSSAAPTARCSAADSLLHESRSRGVASERSWLNRMVCKVRTIKVRVMGDV